MKCLALGSVHFVVGSGGFIVVLVVVLVVVAVIILYFCRLVGSG